MPDNRSPRNCNFCKSLPACPALFLCQNYATRVSGGIVFAQSAERQGEWLSACHFLVLVLGWGKGGELMSGTAAASVTSFLVPHMSELGI
jgi:hypothetical protein